MSRPRFAGSISRANSTVPMVRASWPLILCFLAGLIQSGQCSRCQAQALRPIYDWDFTPSVIKAQRSRAYDAFVTIRNLPDSPVNLLGSRWYALDLFPGAAADHFTGPYRIELFSLAVSSMNLAPGESFTTKFARFIPRAVVSPSYDDLLIAGAYMRFLGPNDEFVDVGGLNKQLRITIVPEPSTTALLALGVMGILRSRRFRGEVEGEHWE